MNQNKDIVIVVNLERNLDAQVVEVREGEANLGTPKDVDIMFF